jgi:hypothetical protein
MAGHHVPIWQHRQPVRSGQLSGVENAVGGLHRARDQLHSQSPLPGTRRGAELIHRARPVQPDRGNPLAEPGEQRGGGLVAAVAHRFIGQLDLKESRMFSGRLVRALGCHTYGMCLRLEIASRPTRSILPESNEIPKPERYSIAKTGA